MALSIEVMVRRRRSKAARISATAAQVAGQGGDRRALGDVRDVRRGLALVVHRGVHHVGRGDHPADAPAGHRVGLGHAVDDDPAVAELGRDDGHRHVRRVAVDEVLVDLVAEHPDVVLRGPAADRRDVVGVHDGARGVRRRDEDQQLGLGRAGALELVDASRESRRASLVSTGTGVAAGEVDRLGVGRPVRRGDQDLVARVRAAS